MSILDLIILGIGLSMDAFAVSICKGLAMNRSGLKECVIPGLWFGGFQALMPLIGYALGSTFSRYVQAVDHWIAFILLVLIGGNMLREARQNEEGDASLRFGEMFMMAVATSIDALAVGVTFAFLDVNIIEAVSVIGVCTFCFSAGGVRIGNFFGSRWQRPAKYTGGAILIIMGTRILLEHLGIIP